jgi:hypothetical protein
LDELGISWIIFADFDFIRKCLSEFLTGRNIEKSFIDQLNALKSDIIDVTGVKKDYKKISEIPNQYHQKVNKLISDLIEHSIYIFSGELEDFYTDKANIECSGLGKEEKAICIASEITITNESNYINIDEIEKALTIVSQRINLGKPYSKDIENSITNERKEDNI